MSSDLVLVAKTSQDVRYSNIIPIQRLRTDVMLAQKALMTRPAPKLALRPLDPFSKLPPEILTIIAHLYLLLSENNSCVPAVQPLTHVSRRLRQIVAGTPSLWATFKIFDAESSFHFARLCIERSNLYPLNIQLCVVYEEGNDLQGDRFYDVLHPVASRIRTFKVYMTAEEAFNIGKGVLARLQMPTLGQIHLHYNSMHRAEPIHDINIPGGANIQVLTLGGLFPTNSNLDNLKSLTLTSSLFCKWSPTLISAFITESRSLENLTFLGHDGVFQVNNELAPSAISTSLRHLAMKGGIAFEFTSRFLLALHAPNLETVHVAAPLFKLNKRTHDGWRKIKDQVENRFLRRKETFGKVRSLVLDPDGIGAEDLGFIRFLMVAFPQITSLGLYHKDIGVLGICNGENELLEAGWAFINQLTIHDNPCHLALDHVLAFVRLRNMDGCDHVEEDEEESGDKQRGEESGDEQRGEEGDDDIGNEDDELEEYQDTELQDEVQLMDFERERCCDGRYGGAQRERMRKVNEEQVDLDFMPIETVIIKRQGRAKAPVQRVISRLRKRVRSVQVHQALGLAGAQGSF